MIKRNINNVIAFNKKARSSKEIDSLEREVKIVDKQDNIFYWCHVFWFEHTAWLHKFICLV